MQAFNGELDLDVSLFGTGPDPGLPIISGAFLFSCNSECFNEFAPRSERSVPRDLHGDSSARTFERGAARRGNASFGYGSTFVSATQTVNTTRDAAGVPPAFRH